MERDRLEGIPFHIPDAVILWGIVEEIQIWATVSDTKRR